MSRSGHRCRRGAVLAAAALLFLALPAKTARAQQEAVIDEGKKEYRQNCASCHGESGMDEGKLAGRLTAKPPDLTRIAKRNGGSFPFWKVYTIIDGEQPVRAHQLSPMPIWGHRYREEEKNSKEPVFLRVLALTHYLESIQEK